MIPTKQEIEWAEADCESFRRGLLRPVDYRFPKGFVEECPPPIFVGQELYWAEWVNGAKLRDMTLLACNTPFGLGWRYLSENFCNLNRIYEV